MDIFKRIFFNENICISIQMALKAVPKDPINNIPALAQIMAWRRPGDNPLSKPMMVSLLMHTCVTPPQWVKWRTDDNDSCRLLHAFVLMQRSLRKLSLFEGIGLIMSHTRSYMMSQKCVLPRWKIYFMSLGQVVVFGVRRLSQSYFCAYVTDNDPYCAMASYIFVVARYWVGHASVERFTLWRMEYAPRSIPIVSTLLCAIVFLTVNIFSPNCFIRS